MSSLATSDAVTAGSTVWGVSSVEARCVGDSSLATSMLSSALSAGSVLSETSPRTGSWTGTLGDWGAGVLFLLLELFGGNSESGTDSHGS